MPDYSKQLAEIAQALSQPTTSVWLVATFSTVLGAFFAVIATITGQLLTMVLTDAYRRYKARRILYLDLTDMFFAVRGIMAFAELPAYDRSRWQEDQLRKNLLFRGEQYCSDNLEIYMQLPERFAAETLYQRFHQILDQANSMHVNMGSALFAFAECVHSGDLAAKYFRRFLGRKRAASLLDISAAIHRQNEEALRRMGEPSNDAT
jgi:hypothetical protein